MEYSPQQVLAETSTWIVEREINVDPFSMRCEVVANHTQYPAGASELEKRLWNSAVMAKKENLGREGKLDLRLVEEQVDGRHSLFGRPKGGDAPYVKVMVAGIQYRYAGYNPETGVLQVEPVMYSETEALKDPRYRQIFEDSGLPLPIGPIAPAALILTADGYVAATVRGTATNKYPGGIWAVGGDIDQPTDLSIGDHLQRREAAEEFGTSSGRPLAAYALGVVFDKVLQKHDLPVFMQYPVPFAAMRKGKRFLPDVESIAKFSARADDLAQTIRDLYVDRTDPSGDPWVGKPTPPMNANLFLLGRRLYGDLWAHRVLADLPKGSTRTISEAEERTRTAG